MLSIYLIQCFNTLRDKYRTYNELQKYKVMHMAENALSET